MITEQPASHTILNHNDWARPARQAFSPRLAAVVSTLIVVKYYYAATLIAVTKELGLKREIVMNLPFIYQSIGGGSADH